MIRHGNYSPIPLRRHQHDLIAAALAAADAGESILIADIFPGSGKTKGYLCAVQALALAGLIDQVVIFVPRANLVTQVETDWAMLSAIWPGHTLGPIPGRDNIPPLVRAGAGGYVTTYQALLANPDLHAHAIGKARTLVVFDEGQQLGVEDQGGLGTRSAALAERLSAEAVLTIVLSGTPYRADGRPLFGARYAPPAGDGVRELIPDVRASYRDGVRDAYLREFEFTLYDGVASCQIGDEAIEELTLSQMEGRLWRVLRQPGYWQPLVDRFVAKLHEVQDTIDPRLRGLIAAADQAQARETIIYLRRTHPDLTVLLATQDERQARDRLKAFQRGTGDILVTVAMAHIGYDCPEISVILPLTSTRQVGWLLQLLARGLRMLVGPGSPPPGQQICYAVVPDDPGMVRLVESVRGDSAAGIREREDRAANAGAVTGTGTRDAIPQAAFPGAGDPGEFGGAGEDAIDVSDPLLSGQAPEHDHGIVIDARLTTVRVVGLDPSNDADPGQLAWIERLRQTLAISPAVPTTKLIALIQASGGMLQRGGAGAPPSARSYLPTLREQERALRRECQSAANRCDTAILQRDPTWQRGETNRRAKAHCGKLAQECTVAELHTRLAWIKAFQREALADRADTATDDRRVSGRGA